MTELLMRAISSWPWPKQYESYRRRFNRRWALVGSLQHSWLGPFARMIWDLRTHTWRGQLRPMETEYNTLELKKGYEKAIQSYAYQVEKDLRRTVGLP